MRERLPFVAIGEALAAGAGDFALYRELQQQSFAVRFAAQMGVTFPLPLLEPPGLEIAPPGYPQVPPRLPGPLQWAVREDMPPRLIANLSIPGLTLSEALHLRPGQPVVQPEDVRATAINVLLGLASFALGSEPLTPVEYAAALKPDLALVALGYAEALEAAAGGRLPEPKFWEACVAEILGTLGDAGARTIVATVPNPFATAAFSTVASAAATLRIDADVIVEAYGLRPGSMLTPVGLMAIGSQFFGRAVADLPDGCVKSAEAVEEIASGLDALNACIVRLAERYGARVFDLASSIAQIARDGVRAGNRVLTAEYLGGVYSLAGCYPGATGHAAIANALIASMNGPAGRRIPEVDLAEVAAADPVAQYRRAAGAPWSRSKLPRPLPRRRRAPSHRRPPEWPSETGAPITLPASRECVLALNPAGSYFGDAIAPLDIRDPARVQWGSSPTWLFGGYAMVDSHLRGRVRVRFSAPANGMAQFELSFGDGLQGEDAVLAAPLLFEMPFQRNRVDEVPGQVSRGTVNLETGEVSDLTVYARYSSTALLTLVAANPKFPRQPLSFPGAYGTAWARFEQRSDGTLDFTFAGTTFVPLGAGICWPLPFAGPEGHFATVPADGTVMHPHLYLTTKPSIEEGTAEAEVPLPVNAVREYVLHTHNSAFGDAFTLTCPELGGPAKGRSHVMGRLQVQFGPETDGCVPVVCSMLGPGGVFVDQDESPITKAFPGRLSTGALGFYELLRFPLRTYALDDLAVISDPFDVSVGLVDRATGRFLHPLLHRGFIHQDLIFALLRVEERTPRSSFLFRGPACVERGQDGRPLFRFEGQVRIPYPQGFLFPRPDLSLSYTIGAGSLLEPFLWLQARDHASIEPYTFDEGAENVVSSTGDVFSYRVRVSGDEAPPTLVYQNHSQQGCFSLRTLTWVSFTNSRFGRSAAEPDTLTLSGLGVWSKDGYRTIQPVAAQFCRSAAAPYVGIQVGVAQVSNVNTRPPDASAARP